MVSMTRSRSRLGELVGLAEHAQDRHAVHAGIAREVRQAGEARDVERAVGMKRRGRDVVDPFEQVSHDGLVSDPAKAAPHNPAGTRTGRALLDQRWHHR